MTEYKNLKVEGENRIDIESVCNAIANQYGISARTALKWLCTALHYEFTMESIITQIDYLLNENILKKDG